MKRLKLRVMLCSLGLLGIWHADAVTIFRLERVVQEAKMRYGGDGLAVADWHNVIGRVRKEAESRRIQDVERFFADKLSYQADEVIWGVDDYWATPAEALSKGRADCEDFAIAKYFSLLFSGVPVKQLRIMYVNALMDDGKGKKYVQAHMVLAYYPTLDAEPLILDNLVDEVLPASKRKDLTPVYGFNSSEIWLAGNNTLHRGVERLSKWNGLLEKMRAEGFE